MGDGTVPPLVEDVPPQPLEAWVEPEPAFDAELAEACVEIAVGLYQDLRESIVRRVADRELNDPEATAAAVKQVALSEKAEKALRLGGVLCAKKYAVNMAYAPEGLLGAGLLLSMGQTAVVCKALRKKGAELRGEGKKS